MRLSDEAICRSVSSVCRLGRGGAGCEKAGLAQANDQAVAAHLDRDGVRGNLVGECLLEFAAEAFEIVFDPGRSKHIFSHGHHAKFSSIRFRLCVPFRNSGPLKWLFAGVLLLWLFDRRCYMQFPPSNKWLIEDED